MATAYYINEYQSYSDRGAFVQSNLWDSTEIDESRIVVGKPLPGWGNITEQPMVTYYDGERLELDLRGKPFLIRVGEEVQIDSRPFSEQHGVSCYLIRCVRVVSTKVVYKGGFQHKDTILERLKGPVGDGQVIYPNGDRFKGYFHLNYAHIYGSCYCADGRYDFADGSYIEHAWIETSDNLERFALHGLFRVKHPQGPDSVAMFVNGRRYGVELFLEKSFPYVREWYDNHPQKRMELVGNAPDTYALEVKDFHLDEESKEDCMTLELTLSDKGTIYRVIQRGGRWSRNSYDSYYYEPSTSTTVYLPNGDTIDDFGTTLCSFRPFNGYLTLLSAATGKSRAEQWENGQLTKAEEWKYDIRGAKDLQLPDPFGGKVPSTAHVWSDGHIKYGKWVYEGAVENDRPEGHGVLRGDNYDNKTCRYEGAFHRGRCHGKGLFVNETANIRQEGDWVEGRFQEPDSPTAPIVLHARYGSHHWSTGGRSDWEYSERDFEAQLGALDFEGFSTFEIVRIERRCLTITHWEKTFLLVPEEPLRLYNEIEGREWSDGCVYDGDDYSLVLTWIQ